MKNVVILFIFFTPQLSAQNHSYFQLSTGYKQFEALILPTEEQLNTFYSNSSGQTNALRLGTPHNISFLIGLRELDFRRLRWSFANLSLGFVRSWMSLDGYAENTDATRIALLRHTSSDAFSLGYHIQLTNETKYSSPFRFVMNLGVLSYYKFNHVIVYDEVAYVGDYNTKGRSNLEEADLLLVGINCEPGMIYFFPRNRYKRYLSISLPLGITYGWNFTGKSGPVFAPYYGYIDIALGFRL